MPREKPDRQEVFDRVVRNIESLIQTTRGEEEDVKTKVTEDTDIFTDLSIDSVEVMDLLVAIEKEFKIFVDLDEAATKRKIGEFVEIVWEKLKG